MNVLGLIASPADPASRFRILQYGPYLNDLAIDVTPKYHIPTKDSNPAAWTKSLQKITGINPWRTWNILQNISRLPLLFQQFQHDLIWQSRMLLPYLFNGEKLIKKPVVFDLDDAVWVFEKVGPTAKAIAAATELFAGNEYLADWAGRYNRNVTLVPTTVDTRRFQPAPSLHSPFTIGWIGTSSNLKYLHLATAAIKKFLATHGDARFVIVSDAAPDFIKFDGRKFIFKQWNADSEAADINSFSVGIMPLTDDEWTRGKCGAKLLQYMACGVPVVASPVGFNSGLLSHEVGFAASTEQDWAWAFEKVWAEPQAAAALGFNGRTLVERQYNTEAWAAIIAQRFQQLI